MIRAGTAKLTSEYHDRICTEAALVRPVLVLTLGKLGCYLGRKKNRGEDDQRGSKNSSKMSKKRCKLIIEEVTNSKKI